MEHFVPGHPGQAAVSEPVTYDTVASLGPKLAKDPKFDIDFITTKTLPSFRRLISLLLPIRYPDRYYNALINNPDGNLIVRVALWNGSKPITTNPNPKLDTLGHVVGGICCRVEPILSPDSDPTPTGRTELYITTLAVLSPFRGHGIAAELLENVLKEAVNIHGVESVYAHVWVANEEALEWYEKRGFRNEGIADGYYRRLNPQSAFLLRKSVGVTEHLRMKGLDSNGSE